MNIRIKKIITACALFLGLGLAAGRVSAAEDTTPVITLGTSLTASQKQGTLDVLKGALSDSSSYNTLTVTGSDLVTYPQLQRAKQHHHHYRQPVPKRGGNGRDH